MGYERINEPMLVHSILDYEGNSVGGSGNSDDLPFVASAAGTSVAVSDHGVRRYTLTLVNTVITVDSAVDGNAIIILTSPAGGGKIIVGATADLTIVLSGGYVGSETVRMALGTAANANSTFAGTEEDIINDAILGGSGLTGRTFSANMTGNTALNTPIIPPSGHIYLGVGSAITSGIGTLTINGTITIYAIEVN